MKNLITFVGCLTVAFFLAGCQKKESPAPPRPAPSQPSANVALSEKPDESKPAVSASKEAEKLVPIPLPLPKPQFVGTPENITGVKNLENPLGVRRFWRGRAEF